MKYLPFDPSQIDCVIFDVDYTLLEPNYHKEAEFFHQFAPNCGERFLRQIGQLIRVYEQLYDRYEPEQFLKYLNQYSLEKLDKKFLDEWILFQSQIEPQKVQIQHEVLTYLRKKGKYLVALSNKFTDIQQARLEQVGLLSYFNVVYGGDYDLKPHKEAFLRAIGEYKPERSVMIGDHFQKDILGAENDGLHAIYYTKGDLKKNNAKIKIRKLQEIKRIF